MLSKEFPKEGICFLRKHRSLAKADAKKERKVMKNNNQLNIPQAREAMAALLCAAGGR